MTLRDGRVFEEAASRYRGGVHEPLAREEIERSSAPNAAYAAGICARGVVSGSSQERFRSTCRFVGFRG